MHQRDLLRQHPVDARLDQRVRLPAADLHDRPRPGHRPSMAASSLRASASFRYSSTNRMGFALRLRVWMTRAVTSTSSPRSQLGPSSNSPICRSSSKTSLASSSSRRAEGKAGVDDHVVAHLRLGHVGQAHLLGDAAKADLAHRHADRIRFKTQNFPGTPRHIGPHFRDRDQVARIGSISTPVACQLLVIDTQLRRGHGQLPRRCRRRWAAPGGAAAPRSRRVQPVAIRSVSRRFWKQPPVNATAADPRLGDRHDGLDQAIVKARGDDTDGDPARKSATSASISGASRGGWSRLAP